jgi:hypothetical protein
LRQPLTERYRERLAGVLSCYDRIIVTGTLPGACYASFCAADPDLRLSAICRTAWGPAEKCADFYIGDVTA